MGAEVWEEGSSLIVGKCVTEGVIGQRFLFRVFRSLSRLWEARS